MFVPSELAVHNVPRNRRHAEDASATAGCCARGQLLPTFHQPRLCLGMHFASEHQTFDVAGVCYHLACRAQTNNVPPVSHCYTSATFASRHLQIR